MRRLLLCSGVLGKPRSLDWLRKTVQGRQPDGVLFAGGVLNPLREYAARGQNPWNLTPADAKFLEQFFETLGALKVFCAVIPGVQDTPVEDFLRLGMHAEIDFPNVHVVHATLREKGDLGLIGLGGAIGPNGTPDPDRVSRIVGEYFLRTLTGSDQPHKILMLSESPPGALGGPDGNPIISDWIDSYHPSLCLVGGPHEGRGLERIAHTLVVNPGHLAEGSAAWLDWTRSAPNQIEMLEVRPRECADVGVGD